MATYSDESIESAQAMSSEPEPQLVDDDDVTIYRDTDAPGEPFSVLFDIRDHGRFARSTPVGGVRPFSRVVASMTELSASSVPILGAADLRVYNVVPTEGRVTVRGEAFIASDINIRVMLFIQT